MSCIPVRMCVVCPKVPASFCNPHHEEEATARNDTLNLIHRRAADLHVHKMQITASVRLARSGAEVEVFTRIFAPCRAAGGSSSPGYLSIG